MNIVLGFFCLFFCVQAVFASNVVYTDFSVYAEPASSCASTSGLAKKSNFFRSDVGASIALSVAISNNEDNPASFSYREEVYKPDGALYDVDEGVYTPTIVDEGWVWFCKNLYIKGYNVSNQLGEWKTRFIINELHSGIVKEFETILQIDAEVGEPFYRFPVLVSDASDINGTEKTLFVHGKEDYVHVTVFAHKENEDGSLYGYYYNPVRLKSSWYWHNPQTGFVTKVIDAVYSNWSDETDKLSSPSDVWVGTDWSIPVDVLVDNSWSGDWHVDVFVETGSGEVMPIETVGFTVSELELEIQQPTASTYYYTEDFEIDLGGIVETAEEAPITSMQWENLLTGETGSASQVGTDTWAAVAIPLEDKTPAILSTYNKLRVTATNSLGKTATDEIGVDFENSPPELDIATTFGEEVTDFQVVVSDRNDNLASLTTEWFNVFTEQVVSESKTLTGGKSSQTFTFQQPSLGWSWQVTVEDKEGLSTTETVSFANDLAEKALDCEGLRGNPIDLSTGAQTETKSWLRVQGVLPINFSLRYNSLLRAQSTTGIAWEDKLYQANVEELSNGNVKLNWSANTYNIFPRETDGSYAPYAVKCRFDRLVKEADGSYTLTTHQKRVYEFAASGRLQRIGNNQEQFLSLSYDAEGRLAQVTEPESGVFLRYQYNAQGLLARVSDALGREVQLVYDAKRRLTAVTNAAGETTRYEYNANNQVVARYDHEGRLYSRNTFDAAGRVVAQTDATGGQSTFAYQLNNGRVTQAVYTNALGQREVLDFNQAYQVIRQVAADGAVTRYEYDANGKRTAMVDAKGNRTVYRYDTQGNRVEWVDAAGISSQASYDANNNRLRYTNGLGHSSYSIYDANNRLLEYTNALSETTRYRYDAAGQLVEVIAADGDSTHYSYEAGQLVAVTRPAGNGYRLGYDAAGRLISITDAEGQQVQLAYDGADRLIALTNPLGQQWQYRYDSRGKVLEQIDAKGNVTRFGYNDRGNRISRTNALGQVTQYEYDAANRLVATVDALGRRTRLVYDAAGRLSALQQPDGGRWLYEYDAVGNVLRQIDPLGHTTTFAYDSRDNLVEQTDALQQQQAFSYDELSRLVSQTDAAGASTRFDYDALNRLVKGVDALEQASEQGFDTDGQRNRLLDPNGNQTRFEFDANGRLVSEEVATGNKVRYGYNAQDLLTSITNARGQARTLRYDAAGRLVELRDADGTIAYSYDANGNVLTVVDASGTITRSYDKLNRVVSYTDARGNTLGYGYDAVGNLTTLTYPDGKLVRYAYDVNDRLIQVTDWAGRVTRYAYDAKGQLLSTLRPNGSQQTRVYDAKGQLLTLKDVDAQGEVIVAYAFDYDAVGNVVSESKQPENPVPQVDLMLVYSQANQLAQVQQVPTVFDKDGNLLEAVIDGESVSFGFDSRNYLTQADFLSYRYDAEGQRITVGDTQFVINSQPSLSQVLVRTKGNGQTTYYVYGLGLIGEESAGNYFSYHFNFRGSTVALSDNHSVVTERVFYAPFGVLLSDVTHDTPFLFNGLYGVMTDVNGLLYMRARFYSPDLRRFVNRDVLVGNVGDGQSLNRYAFVTGNPVSFVDPFGLAEMLGGEFFDGFEPTSGIPSYVSNSKANECAAKCVAQILGLEDLVSVSLVVAGQPISGSKRFVMQGSSVGTSLAGKVADKVFGKARLPIAIPLPVGGPGTGTKLRFPRTKSIARVATRIVPFAGWGLLAVDAVRFGICMHSCLKRGACS